MKKINSRSTPSLKQSLKPLKLQSKNKTKFPLIKEIQNSPKTTIYNQDELNRAPINKLSNATYLYSSKSPQFTKATKLYLNRNKSIENIPSDTELQVSPYIDQIVTLKKELSDANCLISDLVLKLDSYEPQEKLIEKHSKNISAPFFQSDENSVSEDNKVRRFARSKDIPAFRSETMLETKKTFIEKTSALIRAESNYKCEVDNLKEENESLNSKIRELEEEISSARTMHENKIKEIKSRHNYDVMISVKKDDIIRDLEEKNSIANNEIGCMMETQRKFHNENNINKQLIKELQKQIADMEQEYHKLDQIAEKKGEKITFLKEKIMEIKESDNHAELTSKLTISKSKNKDLTENYHKILDKYQYLNKEFASLQYENIKLKELLAETEEKLLKKSVNEATKSPAKPRRTLTMDLGFYDNKTLDLCNDLNYKIDQLSNDLIISKEESEKLSKDLAYYKNLIKEKNVLIGQIESKTKEELEASLKIQHKNISEKFRVWIKSIENYTEEMMGLLKCNNCQESDALIFMLWPCNHNFCNSCMKFSDKCTLCKAPSKTIELTMIKKLYSLLFSQKKKFDLIEEKLEIL